MKTKLFRTIIAVFVAATVIFSHFDVAEATTNSNEEIIYYFLRNEIGLNKAAACGVLANIYYESAFSTSALGDSGTSYGICQWHKGRYTALKNFCKANYYDYKSLKGQLYYLKYELETSYNYILENIKYKIENSAQGAYDAGYYWCYNYEIPSDRAYYAVERGYAAQYGYWEKYRNANESQSVQNIFDPDVVISLGVDIIELDDRNLPTLGDINDDNKVDMLDVTMLQKILADLFSFSEYGELSKLNSDINADGQTDLYDVVMIQRKIAGLKVEKILILE
ncbi:MAG: phage tail tip lysozyme [Clostridia bacterium]|nr:phage tail tip lysozyme [Clostridia bacterium]